MPCDICGHTIHNIGHDTQRIFWCPRCGAIVTITGTGDSEFRSVEPPALVTRVRALLDKTSPTVAVAFSQTARQYEGIMRNLQTLAESVGRAV